MNSDAAVNDVSAVKGLFGENVGANKFAALKADEEVILVTKSAADTNGYSFWYVNGGDLDAKSDDIVVLLGTVAGTTAPTLSGDSFFILQRVEHRAASEFFSGVLGNKGNFSIAEDASIGS